MRAATIRSGVIAGLRGGVVIATAVAAAGGGHRAGLWVSLNLLAHAVWRHALPCRFSPGRVVLGLLVLMALSMAVGVLLAALAIVCALVGLALWAVDQ